MASFTVLDTSLVEAVDAFWMLTATAGLPFMRA